MSEDTDRHPSGVAPNTAPPEKPPKVYVTERGGRYVNIRDLLGSKKVQRDLKRMSELFNAD